MRGCALCVHGCAHEFSHEIGYILAVFRVFSNNFLSYFKKVWRARGERERERAVDMGVYDL